MLNYRFLFPVGGAVAAWLAAGGLVSASSVPVAATVQSPPPSMSVSTVLGSATSGWNASAPSPDSSLTTLTFPTITTSSSSATQYVPASHWVGLSVSIANATGSTEYAVYASSTALASGSNVLPPSDLRLPSEIYGNFYTTSGGSTSITSPIAAVGNGYALSSTSTDLYDNFAASNQVVDLQPVLKIPSGTAPGTYSGTLALTASLQ